MTHKAGNRYWLYYDGMPYSADGMPSGNVPGEYMLACVGRHGWVLVGATSGNRWSEPVQFDDVKTFDLEDHHFERVTGGAKWTRIPGV